ncbi:hypothetical protein Ctob_008605 [Chrysochromulina tobinii]|uniref:Uncharacterized protein n=1 Tax=Chrysochromulina tobinii TaxID=1460289 RepID=A0A0M0K6X7_9EUKA|nr:hypothetical protein Ctob_008605 [Chrysochromulina tobinii]|eukprot:KOO34549.1 hypothetical protein Ctob_008605 [Chrysochromulina sp. CCMP291]
MPNASTDTEQCVATILTRLQLAVTAHQARIVKVLAPGEALERRERDSEHRTPAVTPGTAQPSVPSELRALCSYFGIDVEIDTAGGHAVLREARRVCEQVPSWQQAQHAALAKLELTSAPMIAAMGAACTLGNVVRESGVVAAAAVDTDGSALSETAHAAAHLLQASCAHELHCELRQCLNVLRSVQRTLALRAAGWLPPPLPDGSRLDPEAIASGGLPSSAARAVRSARVQLPDASAAMATAPSAAAAISGVSEGGGAEMADAGVEMADAGVEIAAALTLATCPILPPLRPAPLPTIAVSRRLVSLTAELGRVCSHYGNDSAMAAVYGTGKYDANSVVESKKLRGSEAEAEVAKRLAVAKALPSALRLVSRCFGSTGAAPSASFAPVLAPVLAPSAEERRAAAAGCAAVALALHETVSGLEDRILASAARAYGALGVAHVTPHTHVGRLRCLLLSQGLVIAEPLALPPPLAPKIEPMADEAVREAAMARKTLKKEPVAPWVEAAAVAAVVEQRAYMRSKEGDKEGAGAGESSLDVPPICAHELRKRPALLPTLGVWSAVIELVQSEAAAQSIVGEGAAPDEEAALRVALSTARLGLHASEEGARVAMERELAELSDDLQAEIAEIEERLEEVLAVDLTEAKEQALKTAQAYERQWETAAHDLQPAADKLAEQQHSGGGASPSKFPQPNKAKVEQNRREAEADVHRLLDELRLVISMRKLREHAAESIHARRLEELHNGTSLAIAASLDKPRETSLGTYDDEPQEDGLALRSVAEVLEAERQLSDELRATQKANASLLDKLDSLQAASKATDQEHTTFLHGKVRHLLKQHMGVGVEKPPETRWR